MPETETENNSNCWVCHCLLAEAGGEPHNRTEMHHCIPQAYGGKNGPVVALCVAHHDLLHMIATKRIAKMDWRKYMPSDPGQVERLDYLSGVISTAYYKVNQDPNKRISLSVTINRATNEQIKMLCKYRGLSRQNLILKLLAESYSSVFK